jgi:circadian clock protein KaiC
VAEPESKSPSQDTSERASTGIRGLDEIMNGGFPRNHFYLLEGEPGAGKTTIALQFLMEGAKNGEKGLYVTLSESQAELHGIAESHGWDLHDIEIFELPTENATNEVYTVFHPAEVELQETVDLVYQYVNEVQPSRIVFDSLSEMRLLARDPLRFRRQILGLKQYFSTRDCTVILLDDKTAPEGDPQLHSLAHGVLVLEHISLDYGEERRRLQMTKLRGSRFRGGYHDFRIHTGGVEVYPRLRKEQARVDDQKVSLLSGSASLDALLGGGIMRSSSVLITGAAGTGKSTLVSQYAHAAVNRGERVQFYLFDERMSTFYTRCSALDIDVSDAVKDGRLKLTQIEPTEVSPGEFTNHVMRAVEEDKVTTIVLDSINGYMQSMPEERLLPIQIHELLSYLSNRNVTIFMTLVQRGIFGSPVDEAAEISYLADTVILLRYFEFHGEVRQAISVVKKRAGAHEHTIREARVAKGGLFVGEPLRDFQGVLTGVPNYTGNNAELIEVNES